MLGAHPQMAITFSADLSHASLASLWDHSVSGRALMPGTALLLAASAAASLAAGAQPAAVVGVSLMRPMLMGNSTIMLITQSGKDGHIDIGTAPVDGLSLKRGQSHLTAHVSRMPSATSFRMSNTLARGSVQQFAVELADADSHTLEDITIASVHGDGATSHDWDAASGGGCPRALDATLHLGAVPRAGARGPPALLVPAGLQAFVTGPVTTQEAHRQDIRACVRQLHPLQQGTKLSTHFCGSGAPTSSPSSVQGLLSRPMRAFTASAAQPIPEIISPWAGPQTRPLT